MSMTAAELVPLRALNQVSYCQRLYYLEYVEGLMPLNEFVLDGTFQHRRVADPELENKPRKDGDRLQTRSVALGSETLGLTGKLDVVEEKDGDTYPVETKRSSGPSVPPGYWENDALQVCGQGMLLEEELGRPVRHGFIYYAGSKTRVLVPLDEALREKTLQALRVIRELDARPAPPPPLPVELQQRCHGCSLAPVCQPEETLFLIERRQLTEKEEQAAGLTRVLPQSDAGAVLYLQEQGAFVSKRSEHLIVKKDGAELNRVPIAGVRQVVVFGNVQLSTQALETLAMNQVPVAYLNYYGRFIAAFEPAPAKNMSLRADQYRIFSDPRKALELSRAVVTAKIANQRTLLMRSLRSRAEANDPPLPPPTSGGIGADAESSSGRSRTPAQEKAPGNEAGTGAEGSSGRLRSRLALDADAFLPQPPEGGTTNGEPIVRALADLPPLTTHDSPLTESAVRAMADLLKKIEGVEDPAVLLGIEGQAAALYFGQFPRMLKTPTPGRSFQFSSRNRRPPRDPVNALLSFAYALLAKDCFSALCTVGFDPYCGFFHAGRHGRPSLALDLMEEFRPVIADSVVLTLINTGVLADKDFLVWREACNLTEPGRKRFFQAYEQRKATLVTHPVFGYKMSYSRMLEVQARLLAGYLRGDLPEYIGFTVR